MAHHDGSLEAVAAGRLVALQPEGLRQPVRFYAAVRRNQLLTPAVAAVHEALRAIELGLPRAGARG